MIGLKIIVAGNLITDAMPEKEANDLVAKFVAGMLPPILQRHSQVGGTPWQWAVRSKDVLAMHTFIIPPDAGQPQGYNPRGSGLNPFKN